MISLQKLFSKDEEFYELLETSAEEGRASIQALKRILAHGSHPLSLDELVASRRKDKQITTQIAELMCRVSVTALDREDIEALSNALYKIPKNVEKFAERYIISAAEVRDIDFSKQARLLEEAIDTVVEMLKEIRHRFHMEKMAEQNGRLQRIEGEADELMTSLLKDLYSRRHDTLKVVILKDLYELLEKIVDRCRDAGNVISNIVLKNT
jgi:uncharacterized protein Yka (UPF0111/DUF47 family)